MNYLIIGDLIKKLDLGEINSNWVDQELAKFESNGLKLDKPKKFKGLDLSVKQSIVRIVEIIGNKIGFDQVTIEPNLAEGQADIEFIDDNTYYLEVKSPNIFKSDHYKDFNSIFNQVSKLISSESNFIIGCTVGSQLVPLKVRQIDRQDGNASMGIIAYDNSIPPGSKIAYKIQSMLPEASKQLSRLPSKSKKIFVLDITSYILKSEREFFAILTQEYKKNSESLKSLDGVVLFSSDPNTSGYSFSPIFLRDGINIDVFKRNTMIPFSTPIMIAIKKRTQKGQNNILEIDESGNIIIDGIQYCNFWESLNFLEINSIENNRYTYNTSNSKNKVNSYKSQAVVLTHAQFS